MVDYQLFNVMGSNELIYHWTVKMNEEKKMKSFGMQMLGKEGVFEFLWWMGPYILLNKATDMFTHYFLTIVNQMQMLGNNGGLNFVAGGPFLYSFGGHSTSHSSLF